MEPDDRAAARRAAQTHAPDDRGAGVVSQLDFSATPKYEKGGVFRHVVVDYPLAQAVADGIVKTPIIGEVKGAEVELGDTSFQRNRQWLDVAVGRWRVFHGDALTVGQAAGALRDVREHACRR